MALNQGSYVINVQPAKKTIEMAIRGTFTPEQADEFVKDYLAKVGRIQASDYTMNIDSKDVAVITQDMIPKLETSLRLYQSSGFKKINILIQKNPILKMQLGRVARMASLTNYEFVEEE